MRSAATVRVQKASRDEKWEIYVRCFPPRPGEQVLDVGVSSLDDLPGENYFLRRYPYPHQLTAVGIDDLSGLAARYPHVTFVRADGRALPFPDAQFDVVHSNAVVEHVGDEAEQARFVGELVRVAKAGFVTTPNRWFPIETHCGLPFLHWLPRRLAHALATWLKQPDLGWWLLGASSFGRLFPQDVERATHRTSVLKWPLTLIVVFRRRVA